MNPFNLNLNKFVPFFEMAIFGILNWSLVLSSNQVHASEKELNSTLNQEFILALNWKAEPQFGGFYAADFLDKFKKRGLKIKLIEGGSGTPTVQMLANGKVQLAIVSGEELILSRTINPKNPLVALFATYQTNPQALMTHFEKSYKSIEDLLFDPKATISAQTGLSYVAFLKHKYKDKIRVKWVPYLGGIGTFLADSQLAQQCFFNSEPIAAQRANKKTKEFLIADSGFNPYTTVLAIPESLWKSAPFQTQIRQIVEAVREGWADYLKDPISVNEKMSKINKSMDLETFQKAADLQKNLIKPDPKSPIGTMTVERWQTLIDQLYELKLIPVKPDPKSLFLNL